MTDSILDFMLSHAEEEVCAERRARRRAEWVKLAAGSSTLDLEGVERDIGTGLPVYRNAEDVPSANLPPLPDPDKDPEGYADFIQTWSVRTVAEYRQFIHAYLDKGQMCQVCGRRAARDTRPLNCTMVAGLQWLIQKSKESPDGWVFVPDHGQKWLLKTNQHPSLRWWGLITRDGAPDSRPGWYKPMERGIQFGAGLVKVPLAVVTYLEEPDYMFGPDVHVSQIWHGFRMSDTRLHKPRRDNMPDGIQDWVTALLDDACI